MFVGREKELQELTDRLSNRKFESVLLYGRRRIGKTELIRQAAEQFNGTFLYFECKKSLFSDNIDGLNELLKKVFGYNSAFQSFRDVMKFIMEKSMQISILFVLDELPFLLKENDEIIYDIRELIDEYREATACKLIFSGSNSAIMKSLRGGDSEVKSLFTGLIELKPFDYFDAAKFYPNYRDEDKILMYSVLGGAAFYNSLIDVSLSPMENIKRLLLLPNSILQLEAEYTISSETNNTPMLNSLIDVIGCGITKYSEITDKLTLKKNGAVNIDYLLKKLVDMEIIEKRVPINDSGNRKKHSYCFADNLMHFYFRYIFRNKNMNSILDPEVFYAEFVKEDFEARYIPQKFEEISREYLVRASREEFITPDIDEIGTYSFDKQKKRAYRELSVVTRDRTGYISYKCKYSDSPVDTADVIEEENQIQDNGLDFYRLGFISRSGFDPEIPKEKYNLVSLSELYSEKHSKESLEEAYDCFQNQYTLSGFFEKNF